jgi:uncharacterized membrane protein
MKEKVKNIGFTVIMLIYLFCVLNVEFTWFDAGWLNYAIGFIFTIVPFIGGFVLGMIYKDKLIEKWHSN